MPFSKLPSAPLKPVWLHGPAVPSNYILLYMNKLLVGYGSLCGKKAVDEACQQFES